MAEAKCTLLFKTRSNRFIRYVLPRLENFSSLASGTFNLQRPARSCATISHAPVSFSSFLDGNFAIHNWSFVSTTVALGLAPPREEPGLINWFSHFSVKPLSSLSKFLEASSNVRSVAQGGAAVSLSSERNGPSGFVLNRMPPIRVSSYTPSK